jgi:hypothetical protein
MSVEHLPKHAGMCAVETGIEVEAEENLVLMTLPEDAALYGMMNPFQARLLADALMEAASIAEGCGLLFTRKPQGSA